MIIKIQPLNIQEYVSPFARPGKREDGFQKAQSYHISELEQDELEQLIFDYRRSMLEIWKVGQNSLEKELRDGGIGMG